jgi:hypothetical protein
MGSIATANFDQVLEMLFQFHEKKIKG